MNGGKAFFDTNVLLYMYAGDPRKRARAIRLYREYGDSGRLLLSTQVVQEFYFTGTKKIGVSKAVMRAAVQALLGRPLVVLSPMEITHAIDLEERYQISFWDALIVSAAETGGAEVLYTEDLNDGQRYGAVLVRNPFASAAA